MDYSVWAFLLLAVGLVLLVAEVFIPSGGVILVLAVGSLLSALVCAWYAWWPQQPNYFWGFLAGMVVTLPVSIGLAFQLWPNTPIGRRAILEGPSPQEVDAFGHQERKNQNLVGKLGETATTLNPAGMALIDGERVHCQSEGMIIEPGVRVRVVGSRMNTVIVRRLSPSDDVVADPSNPKPASPPEDSSAGSLDFELT